MMPSFYNVANIIRPGDGYTAKAAKLPLKPILTAQDVEDWWRYLKPSRNDGRCGPGYSDQGEKDEAFQT